MGMFVRTAVLQVRQLTGEIVRWTVWCVCVCVHIYIYIYIYIYIHLKESETDEIQEQINNELL